MMALPTTGIGWPAVPSWRTEYNIAHSSLSYRISEFANIAQAASTFAWQTRHLPASTTLFGHSATGVLYSTGGYLIEITLRDNIEIVPSMPGHTLSTANRNHLAVLTSDLTRALLSYQRTPRATRATPTPAVPTTVTSTNRIDHPMAPTGWFGQGPVRLCSLYDDSVTTFLNTGFGCQMSEQHIPPDSSTYLMGEEYVFFSPPHKDAYEYLWQQTNQGWKLWSRYHVTANDLAGNAKFVTLGLSIIFYNEDYEGAALHFYSSDDPPQECGDRYVITVTNSSGDSIGQVAFQIAC